MHKEMLHILPEAGDRSLISMKKDENIVYIGNKPTMSYVSAIVMKLTSDQLEVSLKARGKAISKAVDTAEIVRNKFLQGVKIKKTIIGTQEIDDNGEKISVSFIEIVLSNSILHK